MNISGINGYARFPHVRGDLLTFVAEDDLWLAAADGSGASRVLSLGAPIKNPRITPDGGSIVFGALQGAAPELLRLDLAGGPVARLTYWGNAKTAMRGFTPDGDATAISAWAEPNAREPVAWTVPLDGSPARRRGFGPLDGIAEDDGLIVLSTALSREPGWWKRYRGGTAGRIWAGTHDEGEFTRLVPDLDGNLTAAMIVAGRIAFLSDHEGYGNLYSVRPDGSDLRRHTDFEGFYARHAATDGTRVVLERAGELYVLQSLDDEARRLDVRLPGGGAKTRRQRVSVTRHLTDVRPDGTGRASTVEVHGTVHWLTHRDGPSTVLEAEDGVRARLVRPLGDDAAVWVSDAGGEESLVLGRKDVPGERARADAPDGPVRYCALEVSPAGDALAVTTEDGRTYVVDVSPGDLAFGAWRQVCTSRSPVEDLAFSPDGRLLAFVDATDDEGRGRVTLADLRSADVTAVTDAAFASHSPAFTRDGKYLAFLSDRSLDPQYDAQRFDLGFAASTKPYLIPLAADTRSPFGPAPDGRAPSAAAPASGAAAAGEQSQEAAEATRIDVEGLNERMIAAPVDQGVLRDLMTAPDALLWIEQDPAGTTGDGKAVPGEPESAGAVRRLDLNTGKCETIVDKADSLRAAGDGTRMIVREGDTVLALPTSGKVEDSSPDKVSVDLDRVRVDVDPRSVWLQAFDEDWRLLRDFFWTPDMGGVDWPAVHRAYRPLVERIGSHDDLVDVLWEIHGELGASHAYVMPAPATSEREGEQGLLGAEYERTAQGWEVTRILSTETSDPLAYSPLRAAGVDVREHDVLVSIDGRPVDGRGPNALLTGAAGKPVLLGVRRPGQSGVRTTVAVPVADEARLRYQQWVKDNRARVTEQSGGAFGYLHVPDMVSTGWAQLHRGLHEEMDHDGVVIDVRGNSGGHTSQLVADLIGHRIDAWTTIRHGAPVPYPADSPRGPVVIVTDEFAGSDGDIITAVCKIRGIGPVIGTRTWGGVIGIDGRFTLADGTGVTQPRYSFWFGGGLGWTVENYGVDPDIEVVFAPHDRKAGRDPQLERAVTELSELVKRRPGVPAPDVATRPNRAPGPLPPRPAG